MRMSVLLQQFQKILKKKKEKKKKNFEKLFKKLDTNANQL